MKTLNELYSEVNSFDEKQTPAQAMQTRRKMARRMKLLHIYQTLVKHFKELMHHYSRSF